MKLKDTILAGGAAIALIAGIGGAAEAPAQVSAGPKVTVAPLVNVNIADMGKNAGDRHSQRLIDLGSIKDDDNKFRIVDTDRMSVKVKPLKLGISARITLDGPRR